MDGDYYSRVDRKCHAPIKDTENKISTIKTAKVAGDIKQEERRLERRLPEERRILEIHVEKKDERENTRRKKMIYINSNLRMLSCLI